MKILIIGGDTAATQADSRVAKRLVAYAEVAGAIDVVVTGREKARVSLSERVESHCAGGRNRTMQLYRLYKLSRQLLMKTKFDLISVQDTYYLAVVAVMFSRRFKIPLEVQVHGFEKRTWFRECLCRFALKRADGIRVVSNRLTAELQKTYGISAQKIYVLPAPIDLELSGSENQEHTRRDAPFRFLAVGRLVPVKRFDVLIAAFALLHKVIPETELYIVGEGPLHVALEAQASNLCHGSVYFCGFQKNIKKYYATADAFVLSSESEGWGMVVIEAAAFGLPITMTDVGLAGQFIYNNKNGLIVPVGDVEALAAALIRVASDEEFRRRLGKVARESYKALPTLKETAQMYASAWQRLVEHI